MTTRAREVLLSEELERAISVETERRGERWSDTAVQLLEEGVRRRRVPGIVFTDGAIGRRATVAGTGLDVWEVIGTWLEVGRDRERLRKAFEWLSERQLDAALLYYDYYPQEIDERLESEGELTQERIRAELPITRGASR